jgi:DNA-binding NtrC family response regulator
MANSIRTIELTRTKPTSMESQSPSAKVMIFEDDPDQLYILAMVLGHTYKVITSDTLKDLGGQLRTHRPDLVLIDNRIGLLIAEELVPAVRQQDDLKEIPFILTSGDLRVQELSEQIGAVAFLQKPFSLISLKEIVERHLYARCVE